MPLLAVVREDVVKLSTINVEKRTELCFSFLIPLSELILIVFMVLFSLAHFFVEMQFLQEAGCLYWLL